LCINNDGRLSLIDWGCVTPVHEHSLRTCGTHVYADQSYVMTNKKATYAYDMFSMGLTLLFVLNQKELQIGLFDTFDKCGWTQRVIDDLVDVGHHAKMYPDGQVMIDLIRKMLQIDENRRLTPIELYGNRTFKNLWVNYPLSEACLIEELPVKDIDAVRQPQINDKMMSIVIEWLIYFDRQHYLHAPLGHAIKLMYRFLGVKQINGQQLQLIGSCCLYLSAIIQYSYTISLSSFVNDSDDSYSQQEYLDTVRLILETLDWKIYPTQGCAELYLKNSLTPKQWQEIYLTKDKFAILPEDKKFTIFRQRGYLLNKIR